MDSTGTSARDVMDITGHVPENLQNVCGCMNDVLFITVTLDDTGYLVSIAPNSIRAVEYDVLTTPIGEVIGFIESSIPLDTGGTIRASSSLDRLIRKVTASRGVASAVTQLSFRRVMSVSTPVRAGLQSAIEVLAEIDRHDPFLADPFEDDVRPDEDRTDGLREIGEIMKRFETEDLTLPEDVSEEDFAAEAEEVFIEESKPSSAPLDDTPEPPWDTPDAVIRRMVTEIQESLIRMSEAFQGAPDAAGREDLDDILDLVGLIHTEMGLSRAKDLPEGRPQDPGALLRAFERYRRTCLHYHQCSFLRL